MGILYSSISRPSLASNLSRSDLPVDLPFNPETTISPLYLGGTCSLRTPFTLSISNVALI
jgi:hypothetical protein